MTEDEKSVVDFIEELRLLVRPTLRSRARGLFFRAKHRVMEMWAAPAISSNPYYKGDTLRILINGEWQERTITSVDGRTVALEGGAPTQLTL